jgi:hypothetical protein
VAAGREQALRAQIAIGMASRDREQRAETMAKVRASLDAMRRPRR